MACMLMQSGFSASADEFVIGPVYSDYTLTLEPGQRTDILGPFWRNERTLEKRTRAFHPILSYEKHHDGEFAEFDVLFPLMGYHQFGGATRYHLFHLLSYTHYKLDDEPEHDRKITVMPFFFHKRSEEPDESYTALFPIYGTLKHRMLRKEMKWVLWPVYLQTEKSDFTTYNYFYPFLHYRTGDHVKGWQFWPIYGQERRDAYTRLNNWDEEEIVPGHVKHFALSPFFLNERRGIGSDNPVHELSVLPFYSMETSPLRSRHSYLWPFFNFVDDREQGYKEQSYLWPFILFARGPGRHETRVLPFYNNLESAGKKRKSILWPLWTRTTIIKHPLQLERNRLLYLLYSDRHQTNLDTGDEWRHRDLWPLYTWRRDPNGTTELQILAPFEPLRFDHPGVARNWSPLWTLWRSEFNAETLTKSRSLLWNTYRESKSSTEKKVSLLFGLFQYHSTPEQRRWRVFFIPFGRDNSNQNQAVEN